MTEKRLKRKLTAIHSVDIKDRSRVTGEAEDATVQTLKVTHDHDPFYPALPGPGGNLP